jgi:hypothetical protein
MVNMSDNLKEYLIRFQVTWINRLLWGDTRDTVQSPDYLVSDGRKRDKVWRELISAGFLSEEGVLLSTAFDQLEIERPDLVLLLPSEEHAKRDVDFWRRRPGILFTSLSLPQRKYVVTNPERYTFFGFDPHWEHHGTKPLTFGMPPPERGRYGDAWICDEEYTHHRTEALYWLEFNTLKRKNLAWALAILKIIPDVDKDCFAQVDEYTFLRGGNEDCFGLDPSQWEAGLDKQVEHSREQIAAYTRKANVLIAAKDKIEEIGGWKVFHERFDAAIHAYIKEKKEKEANENKSK